MFLRSFLVLAILGLAHGDPFTSRDQLKTAVDNCLAVDPTGVSCCERMEGCGPAGTTEMPGWNVVLVTDLSELFKGATAFEADITGWIVEAPNTTDMFYGAAAWLYHYLNCGYDSSDTYICSGSFSGSERPHDGPPNAWVKCPYGAEWRCRREEYATRPEIPWCSGGRVLCEFIGWLGIFLVPILVCCCVCTRGCGFWPRTDD